MKMKLEKKNTGEGRAVVDLEGECTVYVVKELMSELMKEIEQAPQIQLNLSSVSDIDTAGFQLLIYLRREAERRGGRLTVSSMSGAVRSVLSLYREEFA
jgi:anti-sigma B factor antagonist